MRNRSIRSLQAALFIFAILAAGLASREASALSMELASSGGTTITIGDNMAGDDDPTVGVVVFNGSIDNFVVVVMTGISKPVVGSATEARLDLSGVTVSGAAGGTLTVTLTDKDYASGSGDTSISSVIGGTTNGTTTYQSFVDTDNMEFATSGPTVCTSGLQGIFGPGAFDDTAAGNCTVSGDFAITVVVDTAIGPNSVQSFGATTRLDAPLAFIGCRYTGGGVDTDGNWNHELEDGSMVRNGAGNLPAGIDRYQFGGQVGARSASDPVSGEHQHHQQRGPSGAFSFHGGTASAADGTRIVEIRCNDPGFCFPARPAPTKQLDFDGIGTFSNLGKGKNAPVFEIMNPNVIPEPNGKKSKASFTFHWFEVNIDDLGEPGNLNSGQPGSAECPGRGFGEKSAGPYVPDPVNNPMTTVILPFAELAECDCPDFYRITIYKGVLSTEVSFLVDGEIDPTSLDQTTVIYEAFGYIDGGNLQIHPPTGFDTN